MREGSAWEGVRPWAGAAVLAVLACCAISVSAQEAAPPAPPTAPETEALIVRDIEVRGNQRAETGVILRLIRTRVGQPFDARVWEQDWHRLIDAGYFLNVRTTPPIRTIPGGCKLVIELVELAVIRKISFKGNKSIKESELKKDAIKSEVGGRFQEGRVRLDARAIEDHYRDKAFRDVKASYTVETLAKHKQIVADQVVEVKDEVSVTFQVDEGNPIVVRQINFVNSAAGQDLHFREDQLRSELRTKATMGSRDLKEANLDMDKKLLEAFYLRSGYMDVAIDKVDVAIDQEQVPDEHGNLKAQDKLTWNWWRTRKKTALVTIRLTEGAQYHVGKVAIGGNQAIEKSEIEAAMKLQPAKGGKKGSVFSDLLLSEDVQRIKDLYGERGRIFSRVDADRALVTDPERARVDPHLFDVEVKIKEGSEVTVGKILTRGNTKTQDMVVIRELELYPGQRVDTGKLKIAEERLRNLNYFENDLRIATEPTDNPEEANVIVDVTEKATGEFNFGVGFSSVDSVMGNVSLTQRNFDYSNLPKSWRDFLAGNSFVGAGQRFSAELQAGAKTQNYQISVFEPWAFNRPLRMGGSVFRTVNSELTAYSETNTGFSLTVGRRLWGPRWDADLTYRFAYAQVEDTTEGLPPIFLQQQGSHFQSSLTPRLVYDSRDSSLLPSRGMFIQASVEVGGGPLCGSYDWVRPGLDVARYVTLYKLPNGGKHILELRAQASLVQSYWSTNDVPPFMRYYAGGIDTIRGFESRTIAPRENSFLIGGKRMAVATAEYSIPLYEEIVRASAFVDAGSVWDAGTIDPGSLLTNESGVRVGAGLGLSVRVPISPMPIRVYFSRAIKKNADDKTKTVDFTFGTRF